MAATIDLRNGIGEEVGWQGRRRKHVIVKEIDFSANNAGSGDTIQIANLKAGSIVRAFVKPTTAEGGAATIDLKTSETTPKVLINDGNINATALLGSDGADGDAAPLDFHIGEDCVLSILANAALDAAVLTVAVEVLDLNADA